MHCLAAPAAAPAALAGAAGAVDGAAEKKSSGEKKQQPSEETFTEVFATQAEVCKEEIAEITAVNEPLLPSEEGAFRTTLRESSSKLAHEVLDGVSEIVVIAPMMLDEIKDVAQKMGIDTAHLAKESLLHHGKSATDSFKEGVDEGIIS